MGWLVSACLAAWIFIGWIEKVSEEVEPINFERKNKRGGGK